jgi:predicted PurR-regulated permease PerM
MEKSSNLPFYVKCSQVIVGLVAFFYVLYIGQDIIVPLIFATIISILLNPLMNFLVNKKMNRVLAIFLSILIAIIVLLGIMYFIYFQLMNFTDTLPQLKSRFNELYKTSIDWISDTFNVAVPKIESWLVKTKTEEMKGGTAVIGQTLGTLSGGLVVTLLMPVYVFMILFYKPLLLDFISQLFPEKNHRMIGEVLKETKSLIQSYLIGLLVEAAIVATLNSVGLLILGIQYAVLLGIVGALLNMIPYIGGVIAISLPVIIALATKEPVYALLVIGVYLLIQLIDNNFIVPKIVASRVKINALVSIIIVLVGGALWGIAGMFLSIPLAAIIKVICDRVEALKPLGFLLGDTMPEIGKSFFGPKKVPQRE